MCVFLGLEKDDKIITSVPMSEPSRKCCAKSATGSTRDNPKRSLMSLAWCSVGDRQTCKN